MLVLLTTIVVVKKVSFYLIIFGSFLFVFGYSKKTFDVPEKFQKLNFFGCQQDSLQQQQQGDLLSVMEQAN